MEKSGAGEAALDWTVWGGILEEWLYGFRVWKNKMEPALQPVDPSACINSRWEEGVRRG